MACALCPIKKDPHAMHPLYDVNGSEGRQVVNKNGELAWVHTLCAMFISSYNGCIYGCDRDGEAYDANSGTPDGTPNAPELTSTVEGSGTIRPIEAGSPCDNQEEPTIASNSDTPKSVEDDEVKAVSTAYFVIGGKETGKDADWAKETRRSVLNARKDMCFICEKRDNVHGVLRIPVECSAGSKNEPQSLIDYREKPDEICTKPMHVGCAQWGPSKKGGEPAKFRRVFYYPGLPAQTEGSTDDLIKAGFLDEQVACYCNKHAKQIKYEQDKRKKLEKRKRMVIEEEEAEDEQGDGDSNGQTDGEGEERGTETLDSIATSTVATVTTATAASVATGSVGSNSNGEHNNVAAVINCKEKKRKIVEEYYNDDDEDDDGDEGAVRGNVDDIGSRNDKK